MLKLSSVRKTTRRSGSGDLRVVFPHLLRDQTTAPRIEMALRYFESMVGHPRREIDAEMVVQLFGDHKLARCVVECLAPWYRYIPRTFADELPAATVARLEERGIGNPSDLRLWLYRHANTVHSGFVGASERAAFLNGAGEILGLPSAQIDALAALDAPDHAMLARCGGVPSPADVIARYNFETIAALLANAKLVRLTLMAKSRTAHRVADICARAGVRADVSGSGLVLHGRQDALNGWARHGTKLAMVLSALLIAGIPARSGEALIATPEGGEWLYRLDAETLGYLSAREIQPGASDMEASQLEDIPAALDAAQALAASLAAGRRAGPHIRSAWTARRTMDALVSATGIDLTVLTCAQGSVRVPVVLAPRAPGGLDRLLQTARSRPLVLLLHPWTAAELSARAGESSAIGDCAVVNLGELDGGCDMPALLRRAIEYTERQLGTLRIEGIVRAALQAGVLSEARLAADLGCAEDQVAAYLQTPAARAAREQVGLRYVEGFGLCSRAMLERAHGAAADVAGLAGAEPVGPAWTLRVLGRKLREVTGVSEGIECLIAYLGAA